MQRKSVEKYFLERCDDKYLKHRLLLETQLLSKIKKDHPKASFFKVIQKCINHLIINSLRVTGLYQQGLQNAVNYVVEENSLFLKGLPKVFSGFKILHLSDIHLDGMVDKGNSLKEVIKGIDADLCVITGDFRLLTCGSYLPNTDVIEKFINGLAYRYGICAVLGNHDCLELAMVLEKIGVNVLLNEAVPITVEQQSIWLAGVDDSHYFKSANLDKALAQIPLESCKILLSHVPDIYAQASGEHVDFMMSGHTHGGQICLPFIGPVVINCHSPHSICSGSWQHNELQGYTSRGLGWSSIPVRYNCLPEIIVHQLFQK